MQIKFLMESVVDVGCFLLALTIELDAETYKFEPVTSAIGGLIRTRTVHFNEEPNRDTNRRLLDQPIVYDDSTAWLGHLFNGDELWVRYSTYGLHATQESVRTKIVRYMVDKGFPRRCNVR